MSIEKGVEPKVLFLGAMKEVVPLQVSRVLPGKGGAVAALGAVVAAAKMAEGGHQKMAAEHQQATHLFFFQLRDLPCSGSAACLHLLSVFSRFSSDPLTDASLLRKSSFRYFSVQR